MSNLVICVRKDSPFENLRDVLEAAAEKPDAILFGMAQGTPTHFAGRRLEKAGGEVRFRMVASGGGAKRRNDLVGEHVDVTPFSLSGVGARCVRRRAQISVSMHPGCPDEETARLAIERAWSACYRDRAPFDEHPRSKMEM